MKSSLKFFIAIIFFIGIVACENKVEDISSEIKGAQNTSNLFKRESLTAGAFSVLTYNVAGLPGFLSSGDPEQYTATIGNLVNNYDIVHVQEDFNYHATLYANDDHPNTTPTSGGVPFGDGLNTMSNYTFTDFQRIKWDNCNGTDCLTPKGFTVARHKIRAGVYIDFYNAHPNAGSSDSDLSARRANISQLKDFIDDFSAGNAVILMGDLNCRYTRSGDNIRELTTLGLTDAWVELVKGGVEPEQGSNAIVCDNTILYGDPQCEIVDKVFYRGNAFIDLSATSFSYEEDVFRDENGEMLSDHRPINVNFDWELSDDLLLSDQFGGPHGDSFNDVNLIPQSPEVESIFIRSGKRIDEVGLRFQGGATLAHGGSGGSYENLALQSGEYVKEVFLCAGKKSGRTRIFRAEFKTNYDRVLAGGNYTDNNVRYIAPTGWQIVGFHGRSGGEVDKLGVIFAPLP